MFFANSFNEMGGSEFINMVKKFSPQFLGVLEPGTHAAFHHLISYKESIESLEYSIKYPCLKPNTKCPIDKKDWCHQVIRVKNDPSFERLCQKVKVDRRSLPFVFHFYIKSSKNLENDKNLTSKDDELVGRVIQFLGKNKVSYRWRVCVPSSYGSDDSKPELIEIELMRRSLAKKEEKNLENLPVGGDFRFKIEKELSKNKFRVTL